MGLLAHLIVVPVVMPLVTAALLILLGNKHKRMKSLLNITATVLGLIVAASILRSVDADPSSSGMRVYLASNWEAPFGIVLVADRLSALLLVVVGVVSLGAALYAEAAWGRAGVYFHALFQIQLMGLNGAFLTGDLFNLFVFFEVMLAASYGLQLHGSGWPRVRSGMHYIAVNLLASSLFLIGLAMLYGVTGTLSMADLASKVALIPASDRGLLHAGAAILAVAFLTKAAAWPLNAWLVPAYTATSAPVAALFALMTKVGVYALLRCSTLLFSDTSPSPRFGGSVLLYGGLLTLAFGAIGVLSARRVGRVAGFSLIVSSGTLLAAFGLGVPAVTAAALYYLVSATFAVSALFLVVELLERMTTQPHIDAGASPIDVEPEVDEDTNLDEEEAPLVGRVFSPSLARLGLTFMVCMLLVAGLPPLSGFIAKVSLLTSIVDAARTTPTPTAVWTMAALLLLATLASTIALSTAGIRHFWKNSDRLAPRIQVIEAMAIVGLLAACMALTAWAEPVLRYTRAAANDLHAPQHYVDAVMSTQPRPGPTRPVIAQPPVTP